MSMSFDKNTVMVLNYIKVLMLVLCQLIICNGITINK